MERQVARHILLVQANSTPGDDAEFNDWYTNTHVRDVLTVPGVVAAQRFGLSTARRIDNQPDYKYRYLTVYEIEGDPQVVLDAMAEKRPHWHMSPTFADERDAYVFTPITERLTPD